MKKWYIIHIDEKTSEITYFCKFNTDGSIKWSTNLQKAKKYKSYEKANVDRGRMWQSPNIIIDER